MTAVTINLPDALARQLLDLPDEERIARLTDAFSDEKDDFSFDFHGFQPVSVDDLPPGDKAAVLRGLEDAAAGRETPFADAMIEIERDFAARVRGGVA